MYSCGFSVSCFSQVLASWTKERVETVGQLALLWDDYLALMDNHQQIVAKQVRRRPCAMEMGRRSS